MKFSRALQSSLFGRIRHILRTITDYTRWWARFALVELLIVSIVVLPSGPARGGFTDAYGDFTIWAEAGRATHSFAIHEASSMNSPNYFYSGTLQAPGGAKIVGNYAGAPNGMVLRDLTTNEVAPLPDEASNSDIIIPPGAWTNPGDPAAPRTLYIAVPYERSSHQFVVQQGGTSYVATMNSSIQSVWDVVFGQWASEMICTGSALFDPNQSFRIVDLSTNEQFTEGLTFALSNGWEPIPVPPPVHTVNILVDASEVGNTFTVHSMSAGGSEMVQSVTASKWTDQEWGSYYMYDGSSYQYSGGPVVALTATIGEGMAFWVNRDADGTDPQTANSARFYFDPQIIVNGNPMYWQLFGQFPQLPATPTTFAIAETLYQANSGYTLVISQPNGFVPLTLLEPSELKVIVDFDYSGNPHNFYYREYTANVFLNQPYWIVNQYTNEYLTTNPYEGTAYDGWAAMNGTPPPPSGTDWIRVILPGSRIGTNVYELYRGRPDQSGNQDRGFFSFTYEEDQMVNPWTGNSRTVSVQKSEGSFTYQGTEPQGWFLRDRDDSTAEVIELHPGENDLRNWHPSPSAQSVQISLTRWNHDLRIRCENGSEFHVTKTFSQGDISSAQGLAWFNPYYYFDCQSCSIPGLHWFLWDETTQESGGENVSGLIHWISVQPSKISPIVTDSEGAFLIAWTPDVSQVAAYRLEWMPPGQPWSVLVQTEVLMANHGDFLTHNGSLPRAGGTYRFRVIGEFGGHYSEYSPIVTITLADSDGDGLSDIYETTGLHRSNPYLADTDHDGILDAVDTANSLPVLSVSVSTYP